MKTLHVIYIGTFILDASRSFITAIQQNKESVLARTDNMKKSARLWMHMNRLNDRQAGLKQPGLGPLPGKQLEGLALASPRKYQGHYSTCRELCRVSKLLVFIFESLVGKVTKHCTRQKLRNLLYVT
jgi:hypothetical protein